jgi:hypothetical protein
VPVSRTPEQVQADDALTAAIEQCMHAYHGQERPFVLTEYLVITSQQGFDDDGEGLTAVGALYRDNDVPTHRAVGLIEYVGARLRKNITDD